VSISIGRIISNGEPQGFRVRNVYLDTGSYGGFINVGEVIGIDNTKNTVFIEDKSVDAPLLHIGKVVSINPCTGASSTADISAVRLSDTSAAESGGIHIDSVSVKSTHTDMDWGVFLEGGGGFADTRIRVENIIGAQVAPIRFNSFTESVVVASDVRVPALLTDSELALTSGATIAATTHYGRLITNTGAGAGVSHTLSATDLLPVGHAYRFRVTEAQAVNIDVASVNDQIVGTTAPGQHITCSTVGEEIELAYIQTISTIRYWQARIIGNPANWTFN
jgi:hypothetical protein